MLKRFNPLEEVYERRLNFVLVLPSPISRQLDRVLRSRSGGSLEEAIVDLESVQRFYQEVELAAKLNHPIDPPSKTRVTAKSARMLNSPD